MRYIYVFRNEEMLSVSNPKSTLFVVAVQLLTLTMYASENLGYKQLNGKTKMNVEAATITSIFICFVRSQSIRSNRQVISLSQKVLNQLRQRSKTDNWKIHHLLSIKVESEQRNTSRQQKHATLTYACVVNPIHHPCKCTIDWIHQKRFP